MARILFGHEAAGALLAGIAATTRAIAASLGPTGRAVLAHEPPAPPELLSDGYAIARVLADRPGPAAAGARLLKESLFHLDRDLGDGTATAAILMHRLARDGFRLVHAGYAGRRLADAVLALGEPLAEAARTAAVPLPYEQAARAVARSAAGAGDIADRVGALAVELGPEGLIEVEEGHGIEPVAEVKRGTTVDATLVSRDLADANEGCLLRLEQPFVLVADEEIEDFGHLLPVLEGFASRGKALLIVARAVRGPALAALVRNKREAGLRVAALRISDVVDRGYDALEDLAIATGATLVSERLGSTVTKLRPAMLGRAEGVEVYSRFARIIGGAGDEAAIERRRHELRLRIAREIHLSYDREVLQRRLARLSSGYARLRVGGLSAPERRSRLVAARKAAAAVRAAREGVVHGGGVSLMGLAAIAAAQPGASAETAAARRLVVAALEAVPAALIDNAGGEPTAWRRRLREATVARRCLDLRGPGYGAPDAVLDPLPVVVGAVRRALSSAAALLCADALIVD